MKIFVRFGHSNKCQGAPGYLNEVQVIREYAPWVAQTLYIAGHDVRTFNPDTFPIKYPNCDAELMGGIYEANEWGADLFISCHANAPGGSGTEVLCRENDSLGKTIGTKVNTAVSNLLGLPNRGLKHPTNKGELNYTNMSAIIIEPFFVDNQTDCNAYIATGGKNLGETIAKAILQSI